jgi:hypothetical protein
MKKNLIILISISIISTLAIVWSINFHKLKDCNEKPSTICSIVDGANFNSSYSL